MSNEYKYFPFYYIFDEDLKSKLIFDFYNTSTSIKEENSISYMVNEMIGSNIPFIFLRDMFVFKITRTEIQKLDVKSEYIHNKILFKKILNCYNDLRDLFANIGSESDTLEISNFKEEIIYLTAITY
ncbi:MAG: hypothetical protein RLZZ500_1966, partial [Bacteroidota bacterium]